jgi:L,D-transpeptidase YcbB
MMISIRVLVASTAIASVALATPVSAPVAAQSGPAAIDRAATSIADSETAMRHAYDAAGWTSIWTAPSRRALEAILAARAKNGLDHVDFLAKDAGAGSAASIDIAYTRAALAYADALARGRVDPKSVHQLYTIERPDTDLGSALVAAVRSGSLARWFGGLAPQDAEYRALSQAYITMETKSARQSAQIALSDSIHVGDADPRVGAIAAQLVDDGYLAAAPQATGKYTQQIADAVKALQRDYGIADDGIVGPNTLGVLNVSPADRARALAVGLERRRWLSRTPPNTRIDVNTAAAMLRYYRDGRLVDERRVIVGEPDRETPSLGSPIYRLIANPTWTIPKSIQTTELANVTPAYLRAHNMKVQDGWIVQQPGPDNALGLVKFDMKNDQAIYLHDTSARSLFDRSQRHLSHGCVRVSDALGFAKMIADQEGVGEKWQSASSSGDYTIVNLPRQIPVRLLYHNVFVTDAGKVAYRTDPYGWNDAIATKLGFGAAGNNRAHAQSIDVGP